MRVKGESEKGGLKLSIKISKIITSGPITPWEIEEENVETVTDFLFLGVQITAAIAKSLLSCPSLCDPIDGSPLGSPIPGILGKNTGVGCHFLLQCMKVKSESEVA